MDIKKTFPDETSLKQHITEHAERITDVVRAKMGRFEPEFQRQLAKSRWGFGLLVAGVLVFVLPVDRIFFDGVVLLGIMVVVSAVLIIKGISMVFHAQTYIRFFNQKLNHQVFAEVFRIFDLEIQHGKKVLPEPTQQTEQNWKSLSKGFSALTNIAVDTDVEQEVRDHLDLSELVTEPHNHTAIDDVVRLSRNQKKILVAELHLQHVTGSGKNRQVKEIFKGYFVEVELDISLTGKTFISTDGDRHGFGHRSFWTGMSDIGAKETKLEWNDFENLLHVATTNGVEARYVLSTDFMQDLYEWWKDKKGNIRIAFLRNSMYVLFPNNKIRFNQTIRRITQAEVESYLLSIALPLLHVMHLIEDVQARVKK